MLLLVLPPPVELLGAPGSYLPSNPSIILHKCVRPFLLQHCSAHGLPCGTPSRPLRSHSRTSLLFHTYSFPSHKPSLSTLGAHSVVDPGVGKKLSLNPSPANYWITLDELFNISGPWILHLVCCHHLFHKVVRCQQAFMYKHLAQQQTQSMG